MKIRIRREVLSDTETLGSMFIDEKFFAYTLEDRDRDLKSTDSLEDILKKKVKGATAIPSGTYTVILSVSNRFKRLMPEILDVKGFAGIRMHGGNTHLDSEGCPLVASKRSVNKPTAFGKLKKIIKNWIQGSMEAQLTKAIQKAIKNNEEVQITITH